MKTLRWFLVVLFGIILIPDIFLLLETFFGREAAPLSASFILIFLIPITVFLFIIINSIDTKIKHIENPNFVPPPYVPIGSMPKWLKISIYVLIGTAIIFIALIIIATLLASK